MKARDLRNVSRDELNRQAQDLKGEYFTLQEAIRLGKEQNHSRLKQVRRDIARHLSVLRETI